MGGRRRVKEKRRPSSQGGFDADDRDRGRPHAVAIQGEHDVDEAHEVLAPEIRAGAECRVE
jgi:hypothetical protein